MVKTEAAAARSHTLSITSYSEIVNSAAPKSLPPPESPPPAPPLFFLLLPGLVCGSGFGWVCVGGGEAVPDALSLVVDGVERRRDEVGALPYETRITLLAPATGETRLRAEVWSGPLRRTLTSHLWLRRPEAGSAGGGGCAASAAGAGALVGLLCLALGRKRRTPPAPWHGPGDER